MGSPTAISTLPSSRLGARKRPIWERGLQRSRASTTSGFYVDDLEEACQTIEAANATECPGSSRVNRKYKGPDGVMIDMRFRGWDEQIKARTQLYYLSPVPPD